jgi:hypothetical protein
MAIEAFPTNGTYCRLKDIENIFGRANVLDWADLDGNAESAHIDTRIQLSIETSASEINDRFRNGPYIIPFVGKVIGVAPNISSERTITNLSATMAGIWLYENRGIINEDADGRPVDRMRGYRTRTDKLIKMILGNQIQLDFPRVSGTRNAPHVERESSLTFNTLYPVLQRRITNTSEG